jgi:arabinosyltransferase B
LPGEYGPLGALGGTKPIGFTPNGVPEHIVAEAIRVLNPTPGIDYDWEAPVKIDKAGINGSRVPLPYGLDPARVPVAGSYVGTAQQESRGHHMSVMVGEQI